MNILRTFNFNLVLRITRARARPTRTRVELEPEPVHRIRLRSDHHQNQRDKLQPATFPTQNYNFLLHIVLTVHNLIRTNTMQSQSQAGPSRTRAPSLAMLDDAVLIKQGAEAVSLATSEPNVKLIYRGSIVFRHSIRHLLPTLPLLLPKQVHQ